MKILIKTSRLSCNIGIYIKVNQTRLNLDLIHYLTSFDNTKRFIKVILWKKPFLEEAIFDGIMIKQMLVLFFFVTEIRDVRVLFLHPLSLLF